MESAVEDERRGLLVRAALALLEEQGPEAMTARKVTARVGTSSMAVYTEFGSMPGLVSAVVEHGFALLGADLTALVPAEDVLGDIWRGMQATRRFAMAHRHLYAVMFAAQSIAGHERAGDELRQGVETLRYLHAHCERAVAEGRFTGEPRTATRQLWVTMHGYFMLELAGYMQVDPERAGSFAEVVERALIGCGASPDRARAAVRQDLDT